VLETLKIRPAGLVQGYTFAVDHSVGGKFRECPSDLRKSFVEVLVVPGVQNGVAAGVDADGPIPFCIHQA
jgi:hypothetical protein